MKPSVVRAAIEAGETLGRWFEDAIEEKPEREWEEKSPFWAKLT